MKEQFVEIGNIQTLINFKVKDNFVVLSFGTFKLKILSETYSEFRFYIGQEYKKEYLKQVLFVDDKNKIIRYFCAKASKTTYCEKEAKSKLARKFPSMDKDAIEAAIAYLINTKLINDNNYVIQYLDYFNSAYYGKYYIINFFSNKGISKDLIDNIPFDEDKEKEKAINYFGLIKNKFVSKNYAKQKRNIYDSLLKHGFGTDIATELISSLQIDEKLERKKLAADYIRAKNKYSNKKQKDNVQTNKIVSYLVSAGYNYEDINDIIEVDKRGELDND